MGAFKFNFNPITGQFDEVTTPGFIPEYGSDPSPVVTESAWVLRSGGSGGGKPYGLLLSLTQPNTGSLTYQLSYRTLEGTTIRTTLS